MREYEDKTGSYRIMDMDPMTAAHVVRKLLPLLTGFSGLAAVRDQVIAALDSPVEEAPAGAAPAQEAAVAAAKEAVVWAKVDVLATAIHPLTKMLADMSEKDFDFVIQTCLAHVQKLDGGKAVSIWNKRAGSMQFNVKLPTMLLLTGLSIMENAGDFFPERA